MVGIGKSMGRPPARRRQRWVAGRRAVLIVGFAWGVTLVPVLSLGAGPPPSVPLTPQDTADLQRVAAYLNGIRTMYARFQQFSSGGTVTGQLWMARPGRMRFEYDPPSPILLLADMFYVYYVDKELAEMSKVGLKSTPAWLLLRDPIRARTPYGFPSSRRRSPTVEL
jgi:outer membrane lipoprotein-sorting protein